MDAKEIWNEICFLLSESANKKNFEYQVIRAMEKLDWREYRREMEQQPTLQTGDLNLMPDIVLYDQDKNVMVVIEIKKHKYNLSKNEISAQLKSYMLQLKAPFGFIIGEKIKIFYYGPSYPNYEPILIDEIDLIRNSEKGLEFVEVFNRNNLLSQAYQDYLIKSINRYKTECKIKKFKEILVSDEARDKILNYLKNEYSEYGLDIIEKAFLSLNWKLMIADEASTSDALAHNKVLPVTSADTVLAIINSSKKGVGTEALMEKTGYNQKKISNLVYKLGKQGKIKSVDKGVYVKA